MVAKVRQGIVFDANYYLIGAACRLTPPQNKLLRNILDILPVFLISIRYALEILLIHKASDTTLVRCPIDDQIRANLESVLRMHYRWYKEGIKMQAEMDMERWQSRKK